MVTKPKKAVPSVTTKKVTSGHGFIITGALYDRVKQAALLHLSAIATLYFALSKIWGLPAGEEVIGTIAAINVFLGATTQLSSRNYDKHDVGVDGYIDPSKLPDELVGQKQVVLKVKSAS